MFLHDGQKVAFAGDPTDGSPALGDEGIVVSAGNTASHVKWLTGACAGEFTETSHYEISAIAGSHDTDMMASSLISFSAREVRAMSGSRGLLDRLNAEGHLGSFEAIAGEAARVAGSLIRSDPSIVEVIAQLDADDADDFVSLAVVTLLQDAFGQGRH